MICFKEFDVILYTLTACHHWRRMPIPIPMMLRWSDILPIAHSIDTHILFFYVLISVQRCILLLHLWGQAAVEDSYFHVLLFLCMAVKVSHGIHCGFSMCSEVLTYKSQVQGLLRFQKVLHISVWFSCGTAFSGFLSLTILSVLFRMEWTCPSFFLPYDFLPTHVLPELLLNLLLSSSFFLQLMGISYVQKPRV